MCGSGSSSDTFCCLPHPTPTGSRSPAPARRWGSAARTGMSPGAPLRPPVGTQERAEVELVLSWCRGRWRGACGMLAPCDMVRHVARLATAASCPACNCTARRPLHLRALPRAPAGTPGQPAAPNPARWTGAPSPPAAWGVQCWFGLGGVREGRWGGTDVTNNRARLWGAAQQAAALRPPLTLVLRLSLRSKSCTGSRREASAQQCHCGQAPACCRGRTCAS